jgi:glycosidase
MAHFTENHDEPRSIANFKQDWQRADMAAMALLTLPGLRFINQDQWYGYGNKIDVHLRRAAKEDVKGDVAHFYDRLFDILGRNATRYGNFSFPDSDCHEIAVWKWVKDDEKILIAVNLSPDEKWCKVKCPDAPDPPAGSETIDVLDLMTDQKYPSKPSDMRGDGLNIGIGGHQQQVLLY